MNKRKSYSKKCKIDAVKLVTEQGYKISEVARISQIECLTDMSY
ncbi:transposase [Thermodesulfobacteriota bacterium]